MNRTKVFDAEGRKEARKAEVQIIQMPASEVQRFEDMHEFENVKMASELDKKGLPATKLYNEARRLLKVYGTTK